MRSLILIACLLFSSQLEAATLCVNDSTGSDATAKASIVYPGTCWKTIYRAAQGVAPGGSPSAAQAADDDDIVIVAAGTYNINGTNANTVPAYNAINNGSSGHPITFRGWLDEPIVEGPSAQSVILTFTPGSVGSLIGASGVDYVVWEGFYMDEANAHNAPDTALALMIDSTGSKLQFNEIAGMIYPYVAPVSDFRTLTNSPGTGGTTFTFTAVSGTLAAQTPPFMIAVWDPATIYPTDAGVEYLTVTARSGGDLTVTRAQYGTTAKNVVSGWKIATINTDNHTGVRVELATDGLVSNNRLYGYGTVRSTMVELQGHNQSGVIIYNSVRITNEHNEIYDCGGGVFVKATTGEAGPYSEDIIIRFNYVHEVDQGIPALSLIGHRVYQNIVANAVFCATFDPLVPQIPPAPPRPYPTNSWIFNNTFYNCTSNAGQFRTDNSLWGAGNRWWNNIQWGATGAGRIYQFEDDLMPQGGTTLSFEHNVSFTFGQYADDSAGVYTLAQMKGDPYNQEEAALASITVDPGFVNAGAGNFHITTPATVSVGYAIYGVGGPDGTTIPAGAYVTGNECIGLEGLCVTATTGTIRVRVKGF